jgi:hypothetical protein
MDAEQFDRLRNRLSVLSRELQLTKLDEFASHARSKASSLTCANDRQRACELRQLADFAAGLAQAEQELRNAVGTPG